MHGLTIKDWFVPVVKTVKAVGFDKTLNGKLYLVDTGKTVFHTLVRCLLCACILALSIPGVAHAQPQVLTLDDAIAMALSNNYDIILSRNDSASAAIDYSYRNMVFYPTINGTAALAWNLNNQKQSYSNGTDRGGNVSANNLSAALSLNWTLFDGLKMFATRDKAEQYVELGKLTIKNQVMNTVAQVINTYYAIVEEKQQLKAIEEQMEISQITVDLAQRKLDIGAGARPELLQGKVDLNAQKAAQLQQQTLIRRAQGNAQPDHQPCQRQTQCIEDHRLCRERYHSDQERDRPGLLYHRSGAKQSGVGDHREEPRYRKPLLAEVKADRFPTVQLNAAYNFARTNNNIAINPVLPVTNRNRGFNYGLTLSVPILNYRNTQRLIQQAELDIDFQRQSLENQRSLIRLDVVNAYHNFEFQKKALQLEEDNIVLARENVDIVLQTYKLGEATYIQLREAQKSLEDAYNRLITARYQTKLAETELLRLNGDLVY